MSTKNTIIALIALCVLNGVGAAIAMAFAKPMLLPLICVVSIVAALITIFKMDESKGNLTVVKTPKTEEE